MHHSKSNTRSLLLLLTVCTALSCKWFGSYFFWNDLERWPSSYRTHLSIRCSIHRLWRHIDTLYRPT